MKTKSYFLFIIILLCIQIKAQQRFRAGVKAGLSTSQVSGDTYSGFNKAGFAGGAFVTAKLSEKWSGQFEILYVQKGSRHNGNPDNGDNTYYLLQLDYVEVPVLLQYHQKKFVYEAGPSASFLVRNQETFNFQPVYGAKTFNKSEVGVNVGITYYLLNNLGISWRYTNSVTPIRAHASGASTWYNPGQLSTVMAITVLYKFGGSNAG